MEDSAEGVLADRGRSAPDCAAAYRLVDDVSVPREASWCSGVSSTASRVAVSASIGDEPLEAGSGELDGLGDEDWATSGFTEVVAPVDASDLVPLEGSAGSFASAAASGAVVAMALEASAADLDDASAAASAAEARGSMGVAEAAATAAASETAGLAEAADVADTEGDDTVAAFAALAVLGVLMRP